MYKKFIVFVVVAVMTAAMAVVTFSASRINEEEQKVIEALRSAGVPDSQIEQVVKEFLKDGVDITSEEAFRAIECINEARKIVDDAGITTIDELKNNSDVLNQVVAKANDAAEIVGYPGKISVVTDGVLVSVSGSVLYGDANGDDEISLVDSALISRFLAGWNVTLG